MSKFIELQRINGDVSIINIDKIVNIEINNDGIFIYLYEEKCRYIHCKADLYDDLKSALNVININSIEYTNYS